MFRLRNNTCRNYNAKKMSKRLLFISYFLTCDGHLVDYYVMLDEIGVSLSQLDSLFLLLDSKYGNQGKKLGIMQTGSL